MSLTLIDSPLSRNTLSELVFQGEILHFQQVPAMNKFCHLARKNLRKHLSGHTPLKAHKKFSQNGFLENLSEYQDECREDSLLSEAFRAVLADLNFDLDDTYWDRFIMRSVPPKSFQKSRSHTHVNLHRDTWGANIYQQINWWAPIYPLAQNRTIAFFLDHWETPIKNTTASWRFTEYLTAWKQRSEEGEFDYPQVPVVLEEPQCKPFRPVIKPGDLICFSSAHLHGSVPNYSDFTRYSFETRTISLSDVDAGLSSPNIDNEGEDQMTGLFSHVKNGSKLTRNLPLSPLIY